MRMMTTMMFNYCCCWCLPSLLYKLFSEKEDRSRLGTLSFSPNLEYSVSLAMFLSYKEMPAEDRDSHVIACSKNASNSYLTAMFRRLQPLLLAACKKGSGSAASTSIITLSRSFDGVAGKVRDQGGLSYDDLICINHS